LFPAQTASATATASVVRPASADMTTGAHVASRLTVSVAHVNIVTIAYRRVRDAIRLAD
jgi:hypothetical protein